MAFASGGAVLAANDKTARTAWTTPAVSAGALAGNLVVLVIAANNPGDTDSDPSLVSSITDTAGNTWVKARAFQNGEGNADAGAAVEIWYSVLSTALVIAVSTLTVNLTRSTTAKAILGWRFTKTSGTTLSIVGGDDRADDGVDVGSIALSGLANAEYLFIRGIAGEGNAASALTPTSSYTSMGAATTSGGGAATNMGARGGFRILTGTGDTSDPTSGMGNIDHASTMVAIQEVTLSAVNRDVIGLWDVATKVPAADLRGIWNALVKVTVDRIKKWDTRSIVGSERGLLFKVRELVSTIPELRLVWNARALVTRSSIWLWSLREAISRQSTGLWQVLERLSWDRGFPWNQGERIGVSVEARWLLRAVVSQSLATLWTVAGAVTRSLGALWATRGRVTRSVVTWWHQASLVERTTGLIWRARAVVASNTALLWNTSAGQAVGRSLDALWNLSAWIGKAVSAKWNTNEVVPPAVDFEFGDPWLLWRVEPLTAKWNVDGLDAKWWVGSATRGP